MSGTATDRHCLACNRQVHNFAAMTARQIERVVRENEGHLCARLVHRTDGSLVTLSASSQAPMAGRMALAASLAIGATAAAQAGPGAHEGGKARLTGTVLLADGSGPAVGAEVSLTVDKQTAATVKTDSNGAFTIVAPPGNYDISIRQNAVFGMNIPGAELHEGEQTLQPVRTQRESSGRADIHYVAMGEIVVVNKYPVSYLFKHPIRYLKNLPHNFS